MPAWISAVGSPARQRPELELLRRELELEFGKLLPFDNDRLEQLVEKAKSVEVQDLLELVLVATDGWTSFQQAVLATRLVIHAREQQLVRMRQHVPLSADLPSSEGPTFSLGGATSGTSSTANSFEGWRPESECSAKQALLSVKGIGVAGRSSGGAGEAQEEGCVFYPSEGHTSDDDATEICPVVEDRQPCDAGLSFWASCARRAETVKPENEAGSEEPRMARLLLFMRSGREYCTTVSLDDTVGEVKLRVEKQHGIPACNQRIWQNAWELWDSVLLRTIGVHDGSVLWLKIRDGSGGYKGPGGSSGLHKGSLGPERQSLPRHQDAWFSEDQTELSLRTTESPPSVPSITAGSFPSASSTPAKGASGQDSCSSIAGDGSSHSSRMDLISRVFHLCDTNGDGWVDMDELRAFARLLGIVGNDDAWEATYHKLLADGGATFWGLSLGLFARLVDDESSMGLYCSNEKLRAALSRLEEKPFEAAERARQSSDSSVESESAAGVPLEGGWPRRPQEIPRLRLGKVRPCGGSSRSGSECEEEWGLQGTASTDGLRKQAPAWAQEPKAAAVPGRPLRLPPWDVKEALQTALAASGLLPETPHETPERHLLLTRSQRIAAIFNLCDSQGTGWLSAVELRQFAKLALWFDGKDQSWAKEYAHVCALCGSEASEGLDLAMLEWLVNDESGETGCFCTNRQLQSILNMLEDSAVPRRRHSVVRRRSASARRRAASGKRLAHDRRIGGQQSSEPTDDVSSLRRPARRSSASPARGGAGAEAVRRHVAAAGACSRPRKEPAAAAGPGASRLGACSSECPAAPAAAGASPAAASRSGASVADAGASLPPQLRPVGAGVCVAGAMPEREELIRAIFRVLATDGHNTLSKQSMRVFAGHTGFRGGDQEWEAAHAVLCKDFGLARNSAISMEVFVRLLNDKSEDKGSYCEDEELQVLLPSLLLSDDLDKPRRSGSGKAAEDKPLIARLARALGSIGDERQRRKAAGVFTRTGSEAARSKWTEFFKALYQEIAHGSEYPEVPAKEICRRLPDDADTSDTSCRETASEGQERLAVREPVQGQAVVLFRGGEVAEPSVDDSLSDEPVAFEGGIDLDKLSADTKDQFSFLQKSFVLCDRDGDGWLSPPELLTFARGLGLMVAEEDWAVVYDGLCKMYDAKASMVSWEMFEKMHQDKEALRETMIKLLAGIERGERCEEPRLGLDSGSALKSERAAEWAWEEAARCAEVAVEAARRRELLQAIFQALDTNGDGALDCSELLRFARLTGFSGTDAMWVKTYVNVLSMMGSDKISEMSLECFSRFMDDKSKDAICCCTNDDLQHILQQVQDMVSAAAGATPGKDPEEVEEEEIWNEALRLAPVMYSIRKDRERRASSSRAVVSSAWESPVRKARTPRLPNLTEQLNNAQHAAESLERVDEAAPSQENALESEHADQTRAGLIAALFRELDSDNCGRLMRDDMRVFVRIVGLEVSDEDWDFAYDALVTKIGCTEAAGVDLAMFTEFLDDRSEDGCYCNEARLRQMILSVTRPGAVATDMELRRVRHDTAFRLLEGLAVGGISRLGKAKLLRLARETGYNWSDEDWDRAYRLYVGFVGSQEVDYSAFRDMVDGGCDHSTD